MPRNSHNLDREPQAVYFEKFDKLLYDTITEELFDT
jgi:hypothetical protein